MTTDVEMLERAFVSTRSVLLNVKPDQFELPTPCASWDVRALVNHIVGGSHYFAAVVNDGTAPHAASTDFTAGDLIAVYDDGIAETVAAFSAPGALEKMVSPPFGSLPAGVYINIVATDAFSHGWDLARATGQPTDLDPELAAILLERATVLLADSFRGPEGQAPFGARVETTGSVSAADALCAFLGREV